VDQAALVGSPDSDRGDRRHRRRSFQDRGHADGFGRGPGDQAAGSAARAGAHASRGSCTPSGTASEDTVEQGCRGSGWKRRNRRQVAATRVDFLAETATVGALAQMSADVTAPSNPPIAIRQRLSDGGAVHVAAAIHLAQPQTRLVESLAGDRR
jgi:hypothetical protein